MKDEKARYLIIDAIAFYKQLFKVERVFAFNDWNNLYTPSGVTDAGEFFDKYDIPLDFQKIIVKIDMPFFVKYEALEYLTGFGFDLTGGKVEKKDNERYISVNNAPVVFDKMMFNNKIKFNTKLEFWKFDDVIDFLNKVKEAGYLNQYLLALKEFFDVTLEIENLMQLLEEEKDFKKVLCRYKKVTK